MDCGILEQDKKPTCHSFVHDFENIDFPTTCAYKAVPFDEDSSIREIHGETLQKEKRRKVYISHQLHKTAKSVSQMTMVIFTKKNWRQYNTNIVKAKAQRYIRDMCPQPSDAMMPFFRYAQTPVKCNFAIHKYTHIHLNQVYQVYRSRGSVHQPSF
jgi:hypothetical protein